MSFRGVPQARDDEERRKAFIFRARFLASLGMTASKVVFLQPVKPRPPGTGKDRLIYVKFRTRRFLDEPAGPSSVTQRAPDGALGTFFRTLPGQSGIATSYRQAASRLVPKGGFLVSGSQDCGVRVLRGSAMAYCTVSRRSAHTRPPPTLHRPCSCESARGRGGPRSSG